MLELITGDIENKYERGTTQYIETRDRNILRVFANKFIDGVSCDPVVSYSPPPKDTYTSLEFDLLHDILI
jgi:hypothetical protein